METQIFTLENLKEAARLLKAGELVAFPTETVYGLGAMANNAQAVRRVYEVKGRPSDNPLIVHVSHPEKVSAYVASVNDTARQLMAYFWPGPLTLILPLKEGIFAPEVTLGQSTVAVRMPRQIETLMLIEMCGFPLVGPSANLSGRPSPTQLDHVLHDFNGQIAGVVQSRQDRAEVGVESTVVLPEVNQITILRPGFITAEMMAAKLAIPVVERTADQQMASGQVMSPGVKYHHYAPMQPVYLVGADHTIADWEGILAQFPQKLGLLADQAVVDRYQARVWATYSLGEPGNPLSATQGLFAGLRYLETTGCELILAQGILNQGPGHAYMNRLSRASQHVL